MARRPTQQAFSSNDINPEDYNEMIRQHKADVAARDDPPAGIDLQPRLVGDYPGPALTPEDWANAAKAFQDWQHSKPIGHPGIAESFIPVWGSGREALADLQEQDYGGAAFNGALAVSDLVPAKAVLGAAEKGLWKTGSHTWNATRKWMGKTRDLAKGQEVHHWAIPQGNWGRMVPDWIKHQPWNLKAMPSRQVHRRIHTNFGEPRFGPAERFWHGTPAWWKAVLGSTMGKTEEDLRSPNRPSLIDTGGRP